MPFYRPVASFTTSVPFKEKIIDKYDSRTYVYTFNINSDPYTVRIVESMNSGMLYTNISFDLEVGETDQWKQSHKNTPFQVLSTVYHILKSYIAKRKPDHIQFAASYGKLKNIYDKIVPWFEKQGYSLDKENYDYYNKKSGKPEYYFTKNDKVEASFDYVAPIEEKSFREDKENTQHSVYFTIDGKNYTITLQENRFDKSLEIYFNMQGQHLYTATNLNKSLRVFSTVLHVLKNI